MLSMSFRRAAMLLVAAVWTAPLAAQPAAEAPRALSLEDALQLAARRAPSVELARAGLLRARGQEDQARSQFLPQLSGSVSYQRLLANTFDGLTRRFPGPPDTTSGDDGGGGAGGLGPIGLVFASPNTMILGLTGSQTLFAGGQLRANRNAAIASRTAADLGVTSAKAQLALDVTQAYYDAVLADKLLTIAESTYVQTERTFRQVSLTRQVGTASEFSLIQARVARDNQRPQYLSARTQRDVAAVRLRQLLRLPLDAPLALTTDVEQAVPAVRSAAANQPISLTPTALVVDADALLDADAAVARHVDSLVAGADTVVRSRAAVRQASLNVRAQEALLRAQRGQRWPSLALTGNYQRSAYPQRELFNAYGGFFPRSIGDFFAQSSVSLGIQFPIFTGGRITGQIRSAEAGLIEARERLNQTEDAAALENRLAIAELEQAEAAWAASVGTAEQATRGYQIAEVRFKEGISTPLELADSRVQLQQARANRATSARNVAVARMKLALLRDLPLGAVNGASAGAAGANAGDAGAAQGGGSFGGGTGGAGGGQRAGAGGTAVTSTTGGQPGQPELD
ncbi:MAG: TolC family protein [Gemmatimonadaceae bacterium]|jgi:outer membrane protein TolC|nr:TolC family protein [Gemmatimonadaceae bacterium]